MTPVSLVKDKDFTVESLIGEGPNSRKYKSAKYIYQNSKTWKEIVIILTEVSISRDLIIILAVYENGRNMQNFQIVTDRRRIGTNFIF